VLDEVGPGFCEVAEWLLTREAGEGQGEGQLAAAAERVCRKLEAAQREVIGDEGYAAILARAQRLAQAERPYLARLEHGEGAECLACLPDALAGLDLAEARRGLAGLFARALQVSSSLISTQIVLGQVERTWPDLPQRLVQAALKEQVR
jgi:hypothetical protein